MSEEVTYLCDELESLLNETLDDDERIGFAEPDFVFDLKIAKRLYNTDSVTYREGYRDVDACGTWIVRFWCEDGLGGNTFNMDLNRFELNALYVYLCYVIKRKDKDDPEIRKLIDEGIILT